MVEGKTETEKPAWYSIETLDKAKIYRLPALFFSAFAGLMWTAISFIGLFEKGKYGNWAFLYAVIFVVISYGLFKMRSEAAIGGLLIYLVGLVSHWGTIQIIHYLAMIIIHGLALWGTVAYFRLGIDSKT